MWSSAINAVAELDALMSLAAHALNADGPMCRPQLIPYAEAGSHTAGTDGALCAAGDGGGSSAAAAVEGVSDAMQVDGGNGGILGGHVSPMFEAVDIRHPAGVFWDAS